MSEARPAAGVATLPGDAAAPRWAVLLHPAVATRARFRRWLESRIARTDTLLLTQRNVYILPTRAGLMFCITLIVLLPASRKVST